MGYIMGRTFTSKETRDRVWRKTKIGHRRTSHNTVLHPAYVEDWSGPEKAENGFGNQHYNRRHSVLYHIEYTREDLEKAGNVFDQIFGQGDPRFDEIACILTGGKR